MDDAVRTEVDGPALLTLALPSTEGSPGDRPSARAPEIAGVRDLVPIGRGGMGRVWRGHQPELDRDVAVKVMHEHLAIDAAFVARFEREARLLAALRHPGIVSVHDAGIDHGTAYIVMEHVDGRTLREVMQAGPVEATRALGWLRQICAALHHAHARGVIHRDLKPDNILVDADDQVRVTDFGLSTRADAGVNTAISDGSIGGTAAYAAPERIVDGQPGDARTDLYAVGVLAYELLTGRLPLGRFEAVSTHAPVSRDVDAIVDRALHPDPEQRWDDAETLGEAFGAVTVLPRTAGPRDAHRFNLTPGDKLAKGLMIVGTVGLYAAFLAGMPAPMFALGVGLILAATLGRLAIVYLRAPDSVAGTRAGFRFLLLTTLFGLALAIAPWVLVLTGLDYAGLSAGATLGLRVLFGGAAVAGGAGIAFLVRTRRLRLWPLLRGHVRAR